MRRLALLAALALALAACSNSSPVKRPKPPPVVSTTTINFSTYLGNDLADSVRDVVLDSAGNSYVVGAALSQNLLPGTPTRAFAGKQDAFVAKFDATGQVVWWTFLGGPGPDAGYAIDLEPNGDIVIGGSAADQFPVTVGAALQQFQGGAGACDPTQLPTNTTADVPSTAKCDPSTTDPARDGFVARLAAADGSLLWATYFGSGKFEANTYIDDPTKTADDSVRDFNDDADPRTSVVRDIAVDRATGEIYLTFSLKSPLTFFPDPDQTSTTDGPIEPAVVRNLPPVILAALQNGAAPTSPAMDGPLGSGIDGILAKLTPDGSTLLWATYVGGRADESDVMFVKLDSQGNPVVLLTTASGPTGSTAAGNRVTSEDPVTKAILTTEPIVVNAFGLNFNRSTGVTSGSDFYLAKYALNGPLLWATYVGGGQTELIDSASLALRADDTIVIAAASNSADFATAGSWDTTYNGTGGAGYFTADCALAVIAPNAAALQAATFFGGVSGEGCTGVAVDSQNRIYVTGGTYSQDLPIRSGPFQTARPGPRSPFLAVFSADLSTLHYSGYFGGSGVGDATALAVRSDTAGSGRVVLVGESEGGYPLTPAPGSPARGTVTTPPAHGVLSDLTLGF